jgi:hypothetical protein
MQPPVMSRRREKCGGCCEAYNRAALTYHIWSITGPWFMMEHPEFDMPNGKRRFGAYEYPSGKGKIGWFGHVDVQV